MEFIFFLTVSIDDVINALILRSTHLSSIWLKSNLESRSLGIFRVRESQKLWTTELTNLTFLENISYILTTLFT